MHRCNVRSVVVGCCAPRMGALPDCQTQAMLLVQRRCLLLLRVACKCICLAGDCRAARLTPACMESLVQLGAPRAKTNRPANQLGPANRSSGLSGQCGCPHPVTPIVDSPVAKRGLVYRAVPIMA